jgi:hypothetical protein
MKKAVLTLLLISVILSTAFSVTFGGGNDRWTLGIAENTDDQITGSGHVRQEFGNLAVFADYLMITNRGTKEYDGTFRRGRTDILDIAFSFCPPDVHLGDSPFSFSYALSAGISVFGNLGGEGLQNGIHVANSNPPIHLPYADSTVLPLLDLKASLTIDLTENIALGLYTSYRLDTLGNQINALLETRLCYRGLYAGLGMDYTHLWSMDWIPEMYSRTINGPGLDFSLSSGKAVRFTYRMNPSTGRCYGVFTIDTDGFKSEWKGESLIRFVCSRFSYSDGTETVGTSLDHKITDFLDVGLEVNYTCGYQNNEKANNSRYRTRRNYGHWLGGVSFHWDFGFADPYLSIKAGISHWHIDLLTNLTETGSDNPENLANDWYPEITLKAGIRILPEGLVAFGPSTMRIDIFCGLSWFPKELGETLSKDNLHDGWTMPAVLLQYGLGFAFGF